MDDLTKNGEYTEVIETMEDAGFDADPTTGEGGRVIGDLSDVKEKKNLLPPSQNVKFQVTGASMVEQAEGKIEKLRLNLAVADGIEVANVETGVTELKYKGMMLSADAYIWADLNHYTKSWFQDKQHLIDIKKWLQGVRKGNGDLVPPVFNVSNPTGAVDDKMLAELEGQYCVGNIKQIPEKDGYDAKNEVVFLKSQAAEVIG